MIARYTMLWHSVHRRQLVVSSSLVLAALVAGITLLMASCNHLDNTIAEGMRRTPASPRPAWPRKTWRG